MKLNILREVIQNVYQESLGLSEEDKESINNALLTNGERFSAIMTIIVGLYCNDPKIRQIVNRMIEAFDIIESNQSETKH